MQSNFLSLKTLSACFLTFFVAVSQSIFASTVPESLIGHWVSKQNPKLVLNIGYNKLKPAVLEANVAVSCTNGGGTFYTRIHSKKDFLYLTGTTQVFSKARKTNITTPFTIILKKEGSTLHEVPPYPSSAALAYWHGATCEFGMSNMALTQSSSIFKPVAFNRK